jgi:fumarylacetoacetase
MTHSIVQATLNKFMSLGRDAWQEVRAVLTHLLSADNAAVRDDAALRSKFLVAMVSPDCSV